MTSDNTLAFIRTFIVSFTVPFTVPSFWVLPKSLSTHLIISLILVALDNLPVAANELYYTHFQQYLVIRQLQLPNYHLFWQLILPNLFPVDSMPHIGHAYSWDDGLLILSIQAVPFFTYYWYFNNTFTPVYASCICRDKASYAIIDFFCLIANLLKKML